MVWRMFSLPRSWHDVTWYHIAAGTSAAAAAVILGRMALTLRRRSLMNIRREARKKQLKEQCAQLSSRLAQDKAALSSKDEILSLSAVELRQKLKDRVIKPTQVLRAYQSKALEVQGRLNCIAHIIHEAEDWAKELENLEKSQQGPLYGIPVSLKEHIYVKDYDSHYGLTSLTGIKAPEDEVLVKVLKSLGAIPFVKTNLPQLSNSYETCNPIVGRTESPVLKGRIPGGSSGGEGALIAAGGTVLGLGSDLGGSLRVPAHFCGICTLRPTSLRISILNHTCESYTKTVTRGVIGPICHDVQGLVLLTSAILCEEMYQLDPNLAPIGFRHEIFESKKKLRIGFYTDNGIFKPVPTCVRAVEKAKLILESQGHTLVPMAVDGEKLLDALCNAYIPGRSPDRCKMQQQNLKYDIVDPCIQDLYRKFSYPRPITWLISLYMKYIASNPYEARMWNSWTGIRGIQDWFNLGIKVQKFRNEELESWSNLGLDAVICPVVGYPAPPHGTTHLDAAAFTYCRMYNLLDFPSGVLPVTKVTDTDIESMKDYPRHWEYQVSQKAMTGGQGLPVGIQVVGRPFQEEVCLRLMSELETNLKSK